MTYQLEGHMRISTAEREAVREKLATAYGEGRMDKDTLDRRLDRLDELTYASEAHELVRDLPDVPAPLTVHKTRMAHWVRYHALGVSVAVIPLCSLLTVMFSMVAYFSPGGSLRDLVGAAGGVLFALITLITFIALVAHDGYVELRSRMGPPTR